MTVLTPLRVSDAVNKARQEIAAMTGQPVASVISCNREEKNWRIILETVERKAIPDSSDLLASYVVILSEAGEMANFRRLRVRRRGEPIDEPEA